QLLSGSAALIAARGPSRTYTGPSPSTSDDPQRGAAYRRCVCSVTVRSRERPRSRSLTREDAWPAQHAQSVVAPRLKLATADENLEHSHLVLWSSRTRHVDHRLPGRGGRSQGGSGRRSSR